MTIEEGASVGAGTAVWDLSQIRRGARVGADCVIGRNVFIDAEVVVGDRCKIQNNALLYRPAVLGSGVFVGPGAVLSNDRVPRAVESGGLRKSAESWEARGVTVDEGASIGACAVVIAGVRIGAWAMVAAGAVVSTDVPAFSLVVGVPARRRGWVGRAGHRLVSGNGLWRCPVTGARFEEVGGQLQELL